MNKPRFLFVHRSVGENLINDAGLYQLVAQAGNPFWLDDFNQNTGILRTHDGDVRQTGWYFPGNDTTPADYAVLFNEQRTTNNGPILANMLAYDGIIIKSCFPNTRITSDAMLAAHQQAYEQIARFFHAHPGKKLAILASPPLIPLLTLPPFARRARLLAQWLINTDFGPNIYVFDLFDKLAVSERKHQANTLRPEYRRRFPFDSHPNKQAARAIAPELIQFFARVARTK
jgi:hypothetical protein